MKIMIWGIRGYIPTPGEDYIKFGGNTFNIEVKDSNDNILILDMGTGARVLGGALMGREKKSNSFTVLISAIHYDRILGLPFFVPIYIPIFNINIYGPTMDNVFETKIRESMSNTYWPIRMDEVTAKIKFFEIEDKKEHNIDSFTVEAIRTNYLTHCYAYKIKREGKTIVYVSSNEDMGDNDPLNDFCNNADLLIHEALHWEVKGDKKEQWGRSSFTEALKRAYVSNVKKLIIIGFNPKHTDSYLINIREELQKINKEKGYNVDFEIGEELKEYNI